MDSPEKSSLLLDQFFSQQEGLRLCHPENQNKQRNTDSNPAPSEQGKIQNKRNKCSWQCQVITKRKIVGKVLPEHAGLGLQGKMVSPYWKGCTHAAGKQSITSKAHLTPPAIFLPNGNNLEDPKYCLTAWIKEDKEIFAMLLQNWSLHYSKDKRVFVCPHYMKLFQQNN